MKPATVTTRPVPGRVHAVCTRLAGAARTFAVSGPVGVVYALRLAYLSRQLDVLSRHLHRENDLHRENVAALNQELNQRVKQLQATTQAAGDFWKACNIAPKGQP